MAINLNTQYPGRTAGTNTNYPFGQGRNVTTQGDGTGTPFESAWFNDVQGFLQALLQGASLTPSGTPDNGSEVRSICRHYTCTATDARRPETQGI